MALNKKQLQAFADSLAPGLVTVDVGVRKESAFVRVHPNRLMLALAGGATPDTPFAVRDVEGNMQTIILPDAEQLNLTAQMQLVPLADQNGQPMMVDVEYLSFRYDGVSQTIDAVVGKGSPHLRVARTQQEMKDTIKHCLKCLVVERCKARVSTTMPELTDAAINQLADAAKACGMDAAEADAMTTKRKSERDARDAKARENP